MLFRRDYPVKLLRTNRSCLFAYPRLNIPQFLSPWDRWGSCIYMVDEGSLVLHILYKYSDSSASPLLPSFTALPRLVSSFLYVSTDFRTFCIFTKQGLRILNVPISWLSRSQKHAIFILTLNQIPLGTCWFLWIVVPYYFAFSTKIAYIIGNCLTVQRLPTEDLKKQPTAEFLGLAYSSVTRASWANLVPLRRLKCLLVSCACLLDGSHEPWWHL